MFEIDELSEISNVDNNHARTIVLYNSEKYYKVMFSNILIIPKAMEEHLERFDILFRLHQNTPFLKLLKNMTVSKFNLCEIDIKETLKSQKKLLLDQIKSNKRKSFAI